MNEQKQPSIAHTHSKNNRLASPRRSGGFTLMEMMVVLVIIGLLVGLVGPRLFNKVDTAKYETARTQIKILRGAIETMRIEINSYPTTEQGLALLTTPPSDPEMQKRWRGPYLEDKIPLDPWGNPFHYERTEGGTQPFKIYSYGADNKPGGTGPDADIGLPDATETKKGS